MFIDTSFCVDLLREQRRGLAGPATEKLKSLGNRRLFMSIFVVCELEAGARLSKNPRRELHRVELLAELIEVVMPERSFAVAYGQEEARLRKAGIPIPTMDLLIAVAAKASGMPLLTRDSEHFDRIPELSVEAY